VKALTYKAYEKLEGRKTVNDILIPGLKNEKKMKKKKIPKQEKTGK